MGQQTETPEAPVERGPTKERLAKAGGAYTVGDDKRGGRTYFFRDTPLYVLYSRLKAKDRSHDAQEQLEKEYAALKRYRDHWAGAHMAGNVRAIDLGRVQGGQAENASEAYVRHSIAYRKMVQHLGTLRSHIVEQVACNERSTDDCSYLGIALSPYMVRKTIREAAAILVDK